MTPLLAYLVCAVFLAGPVLAAAVLENTERGRRLTDRAVDWILR